MTRTHITIEVIDKNFKRVEEKHDPLPINIKGYEVAHEHGKVIDVGNSNGVTLPSNWLGQIVHQNQVKKQYITDENGVTYIVLSKPIQELPA